MTEPNPPSVQERALTAAKTRHDELTERARGNQTYIARLQAEFAKLQQDIQVAKLMVDVLLATEASQDRAAESVAVPPLHSGGVNADQAAKDLQDGGEPTAAREAPAPPLAHTFTPEVNDYRRKLSTELRRQAARDDRPDYRWAEAFLNLANSIDSGALPPGAIG